MNLAPEPAGTVHPARGPSMTAAINGGWISRMRYVLAGAWQRRAPGRRFHARLPDQRRVARFTP
ncbi:hypothetical protein [Nocardia asiatica]|uniref:hypothetical protein n=1 Tax=Nocardia asiatica TaxID=209252 RepID=UPI0012F8D055|nr:hypothetical protein [Nocardia asiatica]